jgi:hypothetical protein
MSSSSRLRRRLSAPARQALPALGTRDPAGKASNRYVRIRHKFRGRVADLVEKLTEACACQWSAVDGGHVRFVVAFAGGWRQVAEASELVLGQFDAVGGGVLLDAGDSPGAGDRGDVVALGEEPGQMVSEFKPHDS